MEQKIIRTLNFWYYGCFVLAVVAAVVCWYLAVQLRIQMLDPQSLIGQIIQSITIAYVFITVPGALYLFKRKCDKFKHDEDGLRKLSAYRHYSALRIAFIGVGVTIGVTAFYVLSGYTSMIWCAAISAIGLYFCKPTYRKMQLELLTEEVESLK